MFPGPGAQIYYNEAGEPLGWDYPSTEPPEVDDYEPNPEIFDCDICEDYGCDTCDPDGEMTNDDSG